MVMICVVSNFCAPKFKKYPAKINLSRLLRSFAPTMLSFGAAKGSCNESTSAPFGRALEYRLSESSIIVRYCLTISIHSRTA